MSTTKKTPRLLTVAEFLAENPALSENQVRWAIRNRETNGLKPHIFKRHMGVCHYLDADRAREWFTAVVPA